MKELAVQGSPITMDRKRGAESPAVAGTPLDPAAWWCGRCGYLLTPGARVDPEETNSHPLRRDAIALPYSGDCPHCHAREWVDFADVPQAMRLREKETRVRNRGRARLKWGIASIAVAAGGLLFAAFVDMAIGQIIMFTAFISFALSGTSKRLHAIAWGGVQTHDRGPVRRWRRPAVAWPRGARLECGDVDAPLTTTAPLSGRSVIGWVVAICERDEDPRGERPRTNDAGWLLVEQHCEALAIDDRAVKREPILDVVLRPAFARSFAARAWLRTRGFDPDEDLRLFEGVLDPGTLVELRANALGGAPIVTPARR